MNDDVTENDLIAMDPASILEWIDHVSQDRSDLAATFNWLGTAEAAQLRVYMPETRPTRERLAWADVMARALGMATGSGLIPDEYAEKAEFSLRCWLVANVGASSDSPWLDPSQIISAFLSSLDMSIDDAQEMSRDWWQLPRVDIYRLRQIKNRLTDMALIRDIVEGCAGGMPRSDLERWFSLLPQLP
jgi:hypothetical protein